MKHRLAMAIAGVTSVAWLAGAANAGTISGNYCSVGQIQNYPAGVSPSPYWNDFTAVNPSGGYLPTDSASDPLYDDGVTPALGTTIAWATSDGGSQNTNDYVDRPGDLQGGDDEMMSGYLQGSRFSSTDPYIALKATGLDFNMLGQLYSVIVYFDGDSDVEGQDSRAKFEIWASEADYQGGQPPLERVFGRDYGHQFALDHLGGNPLAHYARISSTDELNPTMGNYVQFDGLTSPEFYVRITGVGSLTGGGHGVALNGFQIVPEPASLVLLALGGLAALRRR